MGKTKWLGTVRVVGLLLVLIYHFFQRLLPGGFLGVDMFFTLSGYLMTALIIDGFRKSGEFRFKVFLKRRFTRIFPPLLFAILITLPFTLLISPDFTVGIGRQVAAAAGFVTNYFEILTGGSYEARLLPHLFVHTWTLAVEMHFYIIWGAFIVIISFVLRLAFPRHRDESAWLTRLFILIIAVLLALAGYIQMQREFDRSISDPSTAYFASQTHGFTLMLGSAAGALFGMRHKKPGHKPSKAVRGVAILLTVLSVLAITLMSALLDFNAESTYRFGFLYTSILTIIMIKCALILHNASGNIREPRIIAVTSDLSYCIYLFHWPFYIIFGRLFENNLLVSGVTLASSVAFSLLVFYVLEPYMLGTGVVSKASKSRQSRSHIVTGLRRAAFLAPFTVALAFTVIVFIRAPEVSSLEAELRSGYIYQDINAIDELQGMTQSLNNAPLAIPDFFTGTDGRHDAATAPPDGPDTAPDGPSPSGAPTDNPAPGDILDGVIIIGDSVVMGAIMNLTDVIPDCQVDAEGSRQVWQGYDLIMQLQREERLREYIIVALGTNGNSNAPEKLDQLIADLGPGYRLILVTPYDGRANEEWANYRTAVYMRTLPALHPFVTVADWAEVITPHSSLLGSDKVHIGGQQNAIDLYIGCITDALAEAAAKPAKG